MRTRTEVANELEALNQALSAFDTDDSALFGIELMKRSLRHRRVALEREAAAVSASDLFVVLNGPPIVENSVEVHWLVEVLKPFERAVSAVAQAIEDAATSAGLIPQNILDQSALRLNATFAGSFGMAMSGPLAAGQVELPIPFGDEISEPLFDRAISRVIDVVEAATDAENYEQDLVEQIGDLGQRVTSHLAELAKQVEISALSMEMLWGPRGEHQRRVVLTPVLAKRMQQIIGSLQTSDDEIKVSGRLVEASLPRRSFGIETADGAILRGTIDKDVAGLVEQHFGQQVAADIVRHRTVSNLSGKEAVKHTLTRVSGSLSEA